MKIRSSLGLQLGGSEAAAMTRCTFILWKGDVLRQQLGEDCAVLCPRTTAIIYDPHTERKLPEGLCGHGIVCTKLEFLLMYT